MRYDEIFTPEENNEFEIPGLGTFEYRPTTAGDENDWAGEYLEPKKRKVTDELTGEVHEIDVYEQNITKLNECKMRNLVGAPFKKEHIKKAIGVDKEWASLDKNQRWNVLKKLRPALFSNIVSKIDEADRPLSARSEEESETTTQNSTSSSTTIENGSSSQNGNSRSGE